MYQFPTNAFFLQQQRQADQAVSRHHSDPEPGSAIDVDPWALKFDERYQRTEQYNKEIAQAIADEWDDKKYDYITVCHYPHTGDTLWVVSGMHRTWGARKKGLPTIKAHYIGRIPPEEAALVFATADDLKRDLGPFARLRAKAFGRDAVSQDIYAIMARYGWEPSPHTMATKTKIACVSLAAGVYARRNGAALLDQTLRVLTYAWDHNPKAVVGDFVVAMARFLVVANTQNLDETRLVVQLAAVEPELLQLKGRILGAKKFQFDFGSGKRRLALAMAIMQQYNKDIGDGRRKLTWGDKDDWEDKERT